MGCGIVFFVCWGAAQLRRSSGCLVIGGFVTRGRVERDTEPLTAPDQQVWYLARGPCL